MMNDQEKVARLTSILEDQGLMERIADAGSKESVQKILAENGLDLTMDEVSSFISGVVAATSSVDDELSVEQLENVAGGVGAEWIITTTISVLGKTLKKAWDWGKKLAKYI